MIFVKNKKYRKIAIIISIPILLVTQYYLFKFGILRPMVKGVEIEIVDGEYVKDIDKYVVKLNETVTLSTGEYIKVPSYAKNPNIWFNVLDNSGTLKIDGNKMTALKVGYSSVGIMKNSRVLKKATIKVVDPEVESLDMEINGDLKHVGDSATIESTIEVDYDKFKKSYKPVYKSSNENILKIKGNKVSAVGVGKATIYAKCGNKEIERTFRIQARVAEINMDDIKIEVDQNEKLKPDIITSPPGLEPPKIYYELVDSKLPVERAISLSSNGNVVGLREGKDRVRITCGDKSKVITVTVVKETITNDYIQNLVGSHKIVNNKVIIKLEWDYMKDVFDYDIYLKDKLSGESFKKIKSITINESDLGKSNKVYATIEVDMKGNQNIDFDIYVIGKKDSDTTKPSNVINITNGNGNSNNDNNIKDMRVENISANVDRDNNVIRVNWSSISHKDCTYSIYVKNNTNGDGEFTLYQSDIQGNEHTISIPEGDLNLDIYVVANYNGNSSQNSDVINVR